MPALVLLNMPSLRRNDHAFERLGRQVLSLSLVQSSSALCSHNLTAVHIRLQIERQRLCDGHNRALSGNTSPLYTGTDVDHNIPMSHIHKGPLVH